MDKIIVFCAVYLLVFIVWLAAWVWLKAPKQTKIKFATAAVISGIIALVLAKIADKLYYDPRPFVKSGVKPLFAHGPDNGFPSDHAWFSMTAAVLIYFYNRRLGQVAVALAIIIGIARVAAHVHSPIDIIAGFAIGIVAALAGQLLAPKLQSLIKH